MVAAKSAGDSNTLSLRLADRAWREDHHPWFRLYRFLRFFLGGLIRLLFRVQRVGVRTIPRTGPVILVTNHASNLDPILVVASVPRPLFHLGKHTLFIRRPSRYFFYHMGGQIPVDRQAGGNEAALQAAVRALGRGVAFAIYPEGHRSSDGQLRRGKTGVGRLALLSGAPCYPVAVDRTWLVWPKHERFPRLFRRTRVLVGAPRRYPKDPEAAENRARTQQIADELMGDLAKLLGQPYDPSAALPPSQ